MSEEKKEKSKILNNIKTGERKEFKELTQKEAFEKIAEIYDFLVTKYASEYSSIARFLKSTKKLVWTN